MGERRGGSDEKEKRDKWDAPHTRHHEDEGILLEMEREGEGEGEREGECEVIIYSG